MTTHLKRRPHGFVAIGLAFLTIAAGARLVSAQGNPNPGVPIPRNANAQYGELAARWWQYVISLPFEENPLFDPAGDFALNAQPFVPGNVIFLVGFGLGGDAVVFREITIPAGKRLFFQIVNAFAGCPDKVIEGERRFGSWE
jgi:hypothetical protein